MSESILLNRGDYFPKNLVKLSLQPIRKFVYKLIDLALINLSNRTLSDICFRTAAENLETKILTVYNVKYPLTSG